MGLHNIPLWLSNRPRPLREFNFLGDLPTGMTFARACNATMFDSTGKMVWAPANMFLNSATLATQSVTVVVGQSYTMSAYGTGSVALSNGASGTWTGTGEGNRVSLAFTATTTTATFTVTGSVTSAQLEPTSYNSPQPYIPTTSAAYYGPRFDCDPVTGAVRGLLMEESRQNLLTYSVDFSNSAWVSTYVSSLTGNSIVSPDGTSNATSITTRGLGGRFRDTAFSVTSGKVYTSSAYFKYISGDTTLQLVCVGQSAFGDTNGDRVINFNGSTGQFISKSSDVSAYSIVNVGGGWLRVSGTFTATKTTSVARSGSYAFQTGTTFGAWGAQLEEGSFPTSYIPTYGATATRATDSLTSTSFPWLNVNKGTVYVEYTPYNVTIYQQLAEFGTGSAITERLSFSQGVDSKARLEITAGGTSSVDTLVSSSTATVNAINKAVWSWDGNRVNIGSVCINGGSVNAGNGTGTGTFVAPTLSKFYIGNRSGTAAPFNGHFRVFKIWNYAVADTQLQKVTT